MNRLFRCLALALLATNQSATACRGWNAPPLPRESLEDFDRRTANSERDHEIIVRYERERSSYAEAKNIYFAEIVSRADYFAKREFSRPFPNEVSVRPISVVRGVAPTTNQTLVNSYPHRCVMDGNGYAASGQVGDLVIVFEGVKTHGLKSVDSLMAKDAHTAPLVTALENYIAKTDGGPYRFDEQGNVTVRKADGSFRPETIVGPSPKLSQ